MSFYLTLITLVSSILGCQAAYMPFNSIREQLNALHGHIPGNESPNRTRSMALFKARHDQLQSLLRSGSDADLKAAFRESASLSDSLAVVGGDVVEKRACFGGSDTQESIAIVHFFFLLFPCAFDRD
jgi:hypothetical protein